MGAGAIGIIRGLLATAALAVCAHGQAAIVSVSESITHADPPTQIIGSNNPFEFLFSPLPTTPLTDAAVRIFGLADLGDAGEDFSVTVEGDPFGNFAPGTEAFDESFSIPLASLASYLTDGALSIEVNFSAAVDSPLEGDFITTSIAYRAETTAVPEPGSLALMGLALTGLVLTQCSARKR